VRTKNIVTRRHGRVVVMSNCEGWDQPAVKCAILARPTKSTGLYLQQAGRILRPYRDQQAVILDHAGCAVAHGLPQDTRTFSLETTPKKRKGEGTAPAKVCESCYAIVHAAVRACPECGFAFEIASGVPEESVGELVEVRPVSPSSDDTAAEIRARKAEYRQLLAVAERNDFKEGWAAHQYRRKHGVWPPAEIKPKPKPKPALRLALEAAVRDQRGRVSWDAFDSP